MRKRAFFINTLGPLKQGYQGLPKAGFAHKKKRRRSIQKDAEAAFGRLATRLRALLCRWAFVVVQIGQALMPDHRAVVVSVAFDGAQQFEHLAKIAHPPDPDP